MKLGVVFPQYEIGSDPTVLRDFAQAAESLGYVSLLMFDHVLGAAHGGRERELTGPYDETTVFREPLVFFGFLAGVTDTIGLATGVMVLPQRQTALVAKQVAEVDILSGGRFRLGVGVGWNYVEYQALNEDFRNRGRRQEEQVELLRLLWTEPLVDFTGKWHRVDRAGIRPLPERPVPIWFGGSSEIAFERAVRMGDGFVVAGRYEHSRTVEIVRRVREVQADAHREDRDFGVEAVINLAAGRGRWSSEAKQLIEAGASQLTLRTMDAGLGSPQAHIDALAEFRSELDDNCPE